MGTIAMLDHLAHSGHAGGPQQFAKLTQVIPLVIGERGHQVSPLARTTSSSLAVR
jgi:hypothetical protein